MDLLLRLFHLLDRCKDDPQHPKDPPHSSSPSHCFSLISLFSFPSSLLNTNRTRVVHQVSESQPQYATVATCVTSKPRKRIKSRLSRNFSSTQHKDDDDLSRHHPWQMTNSVIIDPSLIHYFNTEHGNGLVHKIEDSMNERKSSNPCPLLAHQPFLEKFQSTSHQSSSSPPLTLIHTTTTTYNIIPTTTTTPTSPQSKMKSFPRSETFLMLNEFIHQVNSCGFPVLVFNRHFMIEFLNKEAEELFGVYSFAVMGEYLSELLVMDSLNEIRNAIENYLGEDHHTHRHPCDMMQHDQVEETNHPYEIMKPSTSESNMEDSMNDDEESEFDDRRTSITSWQSCHSFNLQLPNIEHIERISTEERKARKQDLMNTRSLTGRASTLKKIFPMKVRLLPLHKTDQTHFAAYIQEVKQSDEDSKHLHGVQFGEAVTELSVIPIIAINKKGIIQFFNSAACSAFKYSKVSWN